MPIGDNNTFNIVVLGKEKSGKTALTNKFVKNQFEETYTTTTESAPSSKRFDINNKKPELQIWDTLWSVTTNKLSEIAADAVIICWDLTDREDIAGIDIWIKNSRKSSPENTPIFLVGTHSDKGEFVVSEQQLNDKAIQLGCQGSFIVSAKTGKNVDETFKTITTMLLEKTQEQAPSQDSDESASSQVLDSSEIPREDSPEISREKLHQTYCKHITGPRIFSKARSNLFGFFNGNDRPANEIIEDLKKRAADHGGASRETCKELYIEYNQPSNGPK